MHQLSMRSGRTRWDTYMPTTQISSFRTKIFFQFLVHGDMTVVKSLHKRVLRIFWCYTHKTQGNGFEAFQLSMNIDLLTFLTLLFSIGLRSPHIRPLTNMLLLRSLFSPNSSATYLIFVFRRAFQSLKIFAHYQSIQVYLYERRLTTFLTFQMHEIKLVYMFSLSSFLSFLLNCQECEVCTISVIDC